MATDNKAKETTATVRDWQKDRNKGYVAHFVPPIDDETDGKFEGPPDAYVWLGLPVEGNPWVSQVHDPLNNRMVNVQPFVDPHKISSDIGAVKVKWIAWDEDTGCNVYERIV